MRIKIEVEDTKDGVVQSVESSTAASSVAGALDGGAPSAVLLETTSDLLPMASDAPVSGSAISAGAPADWLVAAIQNATAAGSTAGTMTATGDVDAGAGPSGA